MTETVDQSSRATSPASDGSPPAPAEATPYQRVGGREGLARIVDRFYEIMDQDPAAATIRAMHGEDLGPIREKLFDFLSGWLGGPPLYFQRPDSKCLHSAHQPYAIGTDERDQWLACMHRALVDTGVDAETRKLLEKPLFMVADSVRNR